MTVDEMLAYCGLVCNECPAFIATKTGDAGLRRQTAKRWSSPGNIIQPDHIICDGCSGRGRLNQFCLVCEVRACVIKKGLAHCGLCNEYVCDKLDRLWKIIKAPEARQKLEELK